MKNTNSFKIPASALVLDGAQEIETLDCGSSMVGEVV